MADKKVSELTALVRASGDDLLLVVNDPSGTPASRKLTVTNFFANVTPEATFDGKVTFTSNTLVYGTVSNFYANVTITSSLALGALTDVESAINQRIEVSNVELMLADYLTETIANTTYGTIEDVNDRMQVANTNVLVRDRMQVANTLTLVNDRLQVANALAQYANSDGTILTGISTAADIRAKEITITSATPTGLKLSGGGMLQWNNVANTGTVPASSNALNEDVRPGTIWYSNNHLYIATDLYTIKRVDLSTF